MSSRISRRLVLALVLALTAMVTVFASCSPFGADPDATSTDAAAEGATGDATANGPDASTSGDGAPFPDASVFKENFDTVGWEVAHSWTISDALDHNFGADNGLSQSTPSSLRAVLPTGASPRWISRAFPRVRQIRAKTAFRVITQGNGNVDFFTVSDNDIDRLQTGSVVFSFGTANTFLAEVNQPSTGQISTPFPVLTGVWVPIELQIDLDAHAWSVQSNGLLVRAGALVKAWNPVLLVLKVGAPYAASVTKPWEIRFDDVEVRYAGGP